jgi:hypothetical protein
MVNTLVVTGLGVNAGGGGGGVLAGGCGPPPPENTPHTNEPK